MFLRSKVKQALFVLSCVVRGQKLPAKRRELRMLGTVDGHEGKVEAALQNISATGVCFVILESALPEEFMLHLESPLERTNRRVRCRRIWTKRFEADGRAFLRVGCAFNESSFQLRWLSGYLTDDFRPFEGPSEGEPEAA
jgi:hypothetical protein